MIKCEAYKGKNKADANRLKNVELCFLAYFGDSNLSDKYCKVMPEIPLCPTDRWGDADLRVDWHHGELQDGCSVHKVHRRKNGMLLEAFALTAEGSLYNKNNESRLIELMSTIPLSSMGHKKLHSRVGKNNILLSDYPEDMIPMCYRDEQIYYEVFRKAGYEPSITWEQFKNRFKV